MRMGYARAFSLLVMGRPLSAAEAKDAGIVNTVVEAAALDATALQAAQEIAALPPGSARDRARPDARQYATRSPRRSKPRSAHFAELLQSDEARAAFQAFHGAQEVRQEAMIHMSLKGKTLFITGASRGIGLAIGLRAARDGANVAIAAKTAEPHPKLPGTIYTAAEDIERAGGKALPLVVDVRDEADGQGGDRQGRGAFRRHRHRRQQRQRHLAHAGRPQTDMKRFDLMHQINTRGTFVVSKWAIPHLEKAANPHILMISPPLDMKEKWFAPHTAYTIAKFGMSLVVLGLAGELRSQGHRRQRAVAAHRDRHRRGQNLLGGDALMRASRKPEIMADAAYAMFTTPAREFTGHFLIDDTFLAENGVTDFEQYRVDPTQKLASDFFVPEDSVPPPGVKIEVGFH